MNSVLTLKFPSHNQFVSIWNNTRTAPVSAKKCKSARKHYKQVKSKNCYSQQVIESYALGVMLSRKEQSGGVDHSHLQLFYVHKSIANYSGASNSDLSPYRSILVFKKWQKHCISNATRFEVEFSRSHFDSPCNEVSDPRLRAEQQTTTKSHPLCLPISHCTRPRAHLKTPCARAKQVQSGASPSKERFSFTSHASGFHILRISIVYHKMKLFM